MQAARQDSLNQYTSRQADINTVIHTSIHVGIHTNMQAGRLTNTHTSKSIQTN